jgi:hypothetical protein
MKKIIISEEEKSRILGLHKNAISEQNLMEQGTSTENPLYVKKQTAMGELTGQAVRSIEPTGIKLQKYEQTGAYYIPGPSNIAYTMQKYYGGSIDNIIYKNVLVFTKKVGILDAQSMEYKGSSIPIKDNNLDNLISMSFVPKALYIGEEVLGDKQKQYIYLFDSPITTNYSGDINKPFITKKTERANGITTEYVKQAIIADLNVKSGTDLAVDGDKAVLTLQPNWTKFGKNFNMLKIRNYDGAVFYNSLGTGGTPIGYVDYLFGYLQNITLGKMIGVSKAQ